MTKLFATGLDELSALTKIARRHARISQDADALALVSYFEEQLQKARDEDECRTIEVYDALEEDMVNIAVEKLAETVESLNKKIRALELNLADHDQELSDLLHETFCSYGRSRDRRRQANPSGLHADNSAGSAIKTTTID